jgi:hypothetical protein
MDVAVVVDEDDSKSDADIIIAATVVGDGT